MDMNAFALEKNLLAPGDQTLLSDNSLYITLAQALISSHSAILVTNLQSRSLYVNDEFERLFGFTQAQLNGRRPSDSLVRDRTDKSVLRRVWESLDLFQYNSSDILLYRNDGRPLWVSLSIYPVKNSEQNPNFYVIVIQDITQSKLTSTLQKNFLESLVKEQSLIEILQNLCREVEFFYPQVLLAFTLVDEKQKLRPLVSPRLPFFQSIVNGLNIDSDCLSMSAAAWYRHQIIVESIAKHPFFKLTREIFNEWGLKSCVSLPITSSSNHILGTFTWFHTIDNEPNKDPKYLLETCQTLAALALEREYHCKRIYRLNFYDASTGLPNRQLLLELMPNFFHEIEKTGLSATVFVINFDRFKTINEAQGIGSGDHLLRDLALRIKNELGEDAIIARLRDDTLIVIKENYPKEQVVNKIPSLFKSIQHPLQNRHTTFYPNASIGISFYPNDGREINTLIHHADQAMHRAKRNGFGEYHLYNLELDNLARRRLDLDAQLRSALNNHDFLLVYQPQVFAKNPSQLYGVEALIRWRHPSRGMVPPADFLPLAEENGLIAELGHWVIRQAAQQLADWRSKKLPIPRLAINLSPRQLTSFDLASNFFSVINESNILPSDLTIEVTECMMIKNKGYVSDNFKALIEAGVRISLDDFGTGYSSLSHLHRLPVEELKLDMSFVHDVEGSLQAQALIHSVLEIGRSLNLHVIVEGVETPSQSALLTQLGCEVLQGYLFSQPMDSDALEQWLGRLAPQL